MAEKKKGSEESSEQSTEQQTPQQGGQPKQQTQQQSGGNKMKIHIESTGPLYVINSYGPLYNVEYDEDTVLMLMRAGYYLTDAATRKRIVLKDGKPSVEQ